jgi:hypothetical protein
MDFITNTHRKTVPHDGGRGFLRSTVADTFTTHDAQNQPLSLNGDVIDSGLVRVAAWLKPRSPVDMEG